VERCQHLFGSKLFFVISARNFQHQQGEAWFLGLAGFGCSQFHKGFFNKSKKA
jgi:hypothetical protein